MPTQRADMNKTRTSFKERLKLIDNGQLILLSLAIGIVTSLAAFLLKNAVHMTHHFLTHHFDESRFNPMYLVYPVIGITLTVIFVKVAVKDNIGHGVSRILHAMARKQGRIKRHNTWSSIIASTITIGFGGSVGAEAPIVLTGSAIGSNIGRAFRLDHKSLTLLIGCGAAGAIAGIFQAPIAGLVFTLEVLMLDLTMASLIPLLIAAVTSASLSYFLMGDDVLFKFPLTESFQITNIPFILILGVFTGFISLYFTRYMAIVEGGFAKIKNKAVRILVGGLSLSLLIFIFPSLYGEGYSTISSLLNGNEEAVMRNTFFYDLRDNHFILIGYLLCVVLFKVFATSITNAAGGVGGIFAPSLFIGGIAGFILARVLNEMGFSVSESNFVLVGMAGTMAGVMHAPLTAMFLIAELTDGYKLILPLMMISVISYLTIMLFEKHSIYHKRLAQRGELLTHHKDKAVLTLMKLRSVIETNFDPVKPEMTLGELVKVIAKSKRNLFPVVKENGEFIGIVLLDDIRNLMFRPEKYSDFTVERLMVKAPGTVSNEMLMEDVMQTFERTGAWNLPVLEDGKYLGFVSKSKIFNSYRKVLCHYSEE